MSRLCHWSLLVGCALLSGLAALPAWEAAACASPLASLAQAEAEVRRPEARLAASEEPAEVPELALASARD